jgi:steroid 5-alpha reductase family enzyme
MSVATLLLANLAIVSVCMFGLWLVSLLLRDASIVDIFWGLGFVIVAWFTYLAVDSPSWRSLLLAGLATVWGCRLSGYLAWRNLGKDEDHRYRAMRERYGSQFPLVSLFSVFALQGAVMWVVSLPLQLGQQSERPLGWLDAAGFALWLVGIFFETVGDWQLARFKANPENRGRVMDRGLWRYTRHPNYFGDFLVWWGIFLVAVSGSGGWWMLVSPVVMSVLLMRISGVTLLESSLKKSRPGYEEYIRRTSAFFPRPPKPA